MSSAIELLEVINNFQGLITTFLLFFAIAYIFPRFSKYINQSKTNELDISVINKVNSLESTLSELKNNSNIQPSINITDEEKSEIITKFNRKLEEEAGKEFILSIEKTVKLKLIDEAISQSFKRIKYEIQSLGNRGTINLFIGILLSFGGVFYLIITMSASAQYTEVITLLSYLTPRILMVIFIEFFSFFFLNLYKKSLDEIKYFQNELTNLEAKYLALTIAKQSGDQTLLSSALDCLLKTERNFILKKDETTIDLEKSKVEAQSTNNTIQTLKDIISFKK